MEKVAVEYPATCVAHWPTGPVLVCDEHARGIIKVGEAIGTHVVLTKLEEPGECSNCRNEGEE